MRFKILAINTRAAGGEKPPGLHILPFLVENGFMVSAVMPARLRSKKNVLGTKKADFNHGFDREVDATPYR